MSKRNFSFLVIGVVVALGLACGPSPEVPEVPSEPTVADIDAERMKLESDMAYLLSEMASLGLILGRKIDGTWYGYGACGNQYTPEARAEALKNIQAVPVLAKSSLLSDMRDTEYEAIDFTRLDTSGFPKGLTCEALQDEYELLPRRLDQLPRERVQAQLRERE